MRIVARFASTGLLCVLSMLLGAELSLGAGVEAITRPSEDVILSFVRAGRIAGIVVKEGDVVAADQLLVQLDDSAERAQLEQLEAQANDETRIEAAKAQLTQKEEDYKKLESLSRDGAATQWDVAHAKLDVTIAELALRLERSKHNQNGLRFKEASIQLERMQLPSPIAGRVERIFLQPGESADALQQVIRVVKIDPLRIEAPVPLNQARELAVGRTAQVAYPNGERATGRITHIAGVADAASDTLTVRVEVRNPSGRLAGEHVEVTFPPAPDTGGEP